MDKLEFINTVISMYPCSFTEFNTQMWVDTYTRKLPNNIDFEALFNDMLVSYENTTCAPSTAFLSALASKQQEQKKRQQEESYIKKQLQKWEKEREEIEKYDRPVTCKILSPLEVLKESYGNYKRESLNVFTNEELSALKKYSKTVIPTEKLRIKFWQEVCSLISGGKLSELCRDM